MRVKKLTTKTIIGSKLPSSEEKLNLYIISGFIRGVRGIDGSTGYYLECTGEFEAINLLTTSPKDIPDSIGIKGTVAILPEGYAKKVAKKIQGSTSLQFSILVSVKNHPEYGHIFSYEELVPLTEVSFISEFFESIKLTFKDIQEDQLKGDENN